MADRHPLPKAILAREALISGAINAAFSAAFVMLAFGQVPVVALRGARGLVGDALPQSLAVAFMASLVPSLMLNRKLKLGRSASIVRRSIATALLVAATALAGHWAFIPPGSISLPAALSFKVAYGALLGAVVTAFSVKQLLKAGTGIRHHDGDMKA